MKKYIIAFLFFSVFAGVFAQSYTPRLNKVFQLKDVCHALSGIQFEQMLPNEKLIQGNFIKNVIKNASPAALTGVVSIALANFIGTTFLNLERPILSTICTFIWAVVGLINLFMLCRPFDKWKIMIVSGCITGMILFSIFLKNLFGLEDNLGIAAWGVFAGSVVLLIPVGIVMKKLTELVYKKILN